MSTEHATSNTTEEVAVIAYHDNCIDGFTAAWVAARALEEQGFTRITLLPMQYSAESERELLDTLAASHTITALYVVDFSLTLPAIHELNHLLHLEVTIIDHHKTAFERYCPKMEVTATSTYSDLAVNVHILLDNAECGASLVHKHFYSEWLLLPTLVTFVKDYDLWQHKLADTLPINKVLQTLDKQLDEWDLIASRLEHRITRNAVVAEGRRLQEAHDRQVALICKGAETIQLVGHIGSAVCCSGTYASDVGHVLSKVHNTFGATFRASKCGNRVDWSLRSEGDFDVSKMAKFLGGGGHKNAAGFSITKEEMQEYTDYDRSLRSKRQK